MLTKLKVLRDLLCKHISVDNPFRSSYFVISCEMCNYVSCLVSPPRVRVLYLLPVPCVSSPPPPHSKCPLVLCLFSFKVLLVLDLQSYKKPNLPY
jgi:hypothetical protein